MMEDPELPAEMKEGADTSQKELAALEKRRNREKKRKRGVHERVSSKRSTVAKK